MLANQESKQQCRMSSIDQSTSDVWIFSFQYYIINTDDTMLATVMNKPKMNWKIGRDHEKNYRLTERRERKKKIKREADVGSRRPVLFSDVLLIRRKRGKWPIGDARSADPIRPQACADRPVFLWAAAVGAASSPFSFRMVVRQKDNQHIFSGYSSSNLDWGGKFELQTFDECSGGKPFDRR